MADDEELIRRGLDRIAAAARILQRVVSPIYASVNGRPYLVGTGVLLRLVDQIILVSAAHVLENSSPAPESFGLSGQLERLPVLHFVSPMPVTGDRNEDRTDLAFWILPPDQARTVVSADTVQPTTLDLGRCDGGADDRFLLIGYPHNRSRTPLSTSNALPLISWTFLAEELGSEAYAMENLDHANNLFIDFGKRVWRDFRPVTPTKPVGASGAPIWRLTTSSTQGPLLAGTAIEYRPRGRNKGIIATRIDVLQRLVYEQMPRLGKAMRPRASRH